MKLRVKFNKRNYLKYISHLDLMRLFQRSFNRAEIPVEYSKGFNPQPRFSIASPLSLGIESEEEYMDIELERKVSVEDFKDRMNKVLPKDVQIIEGIYPEDDRAIAAIIEWGLYEMAIKKNDTLDLGILNNRLKAWLEKDEILISRFRKKGRKKVMKEENIKPLIKTIEVKNIIDNEIIVEALIKTGDKGNLRPLDFIEALIRDNDLEEYKDGISLKRLGLFMEEQGEIYKPI